jgi:hypothetical protein
MVAAYAASVCKSLCRNRAGDDVAGIINHIASIIDCKGHDQHKGLMVGSSEKQFFFLACEAVLLHPTSG